MKHVRFTNAHQSITFSRRMMLVSGAQAAIGAMLVGRMGWLAVAQNQKYQLLSESNRVNMTLIPPRRGWIIDRHGAPIANNRTDFRVDIIPDRLRDKERVLPLLGRILQLPPEEIERIAIDLDHAAGFQPVQVAENLDWERFAAVSVRRRKMRIGSSGAADRSSMTTKASTSASAAPSSPSVDVVAHPSFVARVSA